MTTTRRACIGDGGASGLIRLDIGAGPTFALRAAQICTSQESCDAPE